VRLSGQSQVGAGESYELNAERELAEEMGISGVTLTHILDEFFEDHETRLWGRLFSCEYDGPITIQESEVDSVQWMSYSEVCTMVMEQSHTVCPDSLTMFKAYMESRGQS